MAMNYVRFKSVLGNMTTAAQKVYAAIPAFDSWTHDEINAELKRLGSHMDYKTMQGCINSLMGAGLVRELAGTGKRHRFSRMEVRGKPTKTLDEQETEAVTEPPKEEPMTTLVIATTKITETKNPVDLLGDLAVKARSISTQLLALANEIDPAAIAAQDYVEHSDKDTEKLRQLQSLLKGLV